MERQDFEQAINELYCFFQFKKSPTEDVLDMWFKKIRHIPSNAIPWIIDRIQELDSFPRNLPMSVYSFYMEFKRGKDIGVDYNPEEDLRFPVSKMYTAFSILENSGESAFVNYCNTHKMPRADRERVLSKFKYCFDQQPLIDNVGTHVNPGERNGQEKIPF